MTALLGCIADDFTGATDLANTLVRNVMSTVQTIGVTAAVAVADIGAADALVVALKSRTIPAAEAVAQSLAALQWLRAQGCRQFVFKYCSTFDSTDAGNIGPVAEALLAALDSDFTIACPAFPENGRTIFRGHLFVGDALLNESGMEHHPLTPMTDANLVRVLQRQSKHKVGLLRYDAVARGAQATAGGIAALRGAGVRMAIADAVSDADLLTLGEACAGLPLVTGGSGIALGLPQNFRKAGLLDVQAAADTLDTPQGLRAVISGSCSVATNAQVAHFTAAGRPAFAVDPLQLAAGVDVVGQALAWAQPLLAEGPPLVYATAAPDSVKAAQGALGVE
ncbi:MAG: four-carbon acid sugar kinase family protein, partial [Cupriavidus sp.]|nr:four-carbon acid sugar kinase family protein [Cupriavidus sp.]